ncbi:PREDICTED: polycystic kidney disease 2-like 1 protein isoform X1 [Drosophila arizonae]|uniref:Polycystic kidney disease 2-like 1 protein isoform X1 n=1 Tax=Drosophila arizonae TaxID=7263 RepID=A0ABM1Q346_DROAR|nr:PREDICTED: polycystic kidney disease 2-like 1 protein isoform X1 [Drosophila arizonae]
MPARYTRKPSYQILSERIIQNIITEFFILLILLVSTQIITETVVHKYSYYSYKQTKHAFVQESNYRSHHKYIGPVFANVQKIWDIWDFASFNFLYILHHEKNFTGEKRDEFPFVFNMGLMMGVPRLRQIRVKQTRCPQKINFIDIHGKKCYPNYLPKNEFKGTYQQIDYVADAKSLQPTFVTYSGGGFPINLQFDYKGNRKLLRNLMKAGWIDSATRLFVIEFSIYFQDINMIQVLKLMFEIMPTGLVMPSAFIQGIQINSFLTLTPVTISAGAIFSIIVIYYTYVEIREIKWVGPSAYKNNFYNYVDVLFLIAAYCVLFYNVWHIVTIKDIEKVYAKNHRRYINMDKLSTGWNVYLHMLGIMNALVWLKPIRFISFHRSIQQVLAAMRVSIKSILGLCFFCLISIYAFAQLGCIAFSQSNEEYTTEFSSIVAQIRFLMNDISYTSLEDAHRVLAPFFFVVLAVVSYAIILNLFKAIYLSADSDVKKQLIINDMVIARMLQAGFKRYLCIWRKRSTAQINLTPRLRPTDKLPGISVDNRAKPTPNPSQQMKIITELRDLMAIQSENCARIENMMEIFVDIMENIEKLHHINKISTGRKN